MIYKGYEIVPSTRPGSSVKGTKTNNGIQVRESLGKGAYLLKKTFMYPAQDMIKKQKAIDKAMAFVDELILLKNEKGTSI